MSASTLILRAVLLWSYQDDPIAEEHTCAAVVVCEPEAQSCEARVQGPCAWNLEDCLEATAVVAGRALDVLGCAVDLRAVDVDRDAVRAAQRAARARRGR